MGKAQEILNKSELAEIAKSLLEKSSEMKQGVEIRGLCPIHGEENPSMNYNSVKDAYYCHVCSASGDIIKLYRIIHGLSKKDGFKQFMKKYESNSVIKKTVHNKQKDEVEQKKTIADDLDHVFSLFPLLPPKWIKKFQSDRGWKQEVIDSLDLRLQTHYRTKEGELKELPFEKMRKVAIPIKDSKGKVKNIRTYLPAQDTYNWSGHGASRLYPHPSNWILEGPIFLVEGESDLICALSHGLNAVTTTTGCNTWKSVFNKDFEDRDVIICYDADIPGAEGAEKVAKSLVKYARSVREIRWPDYMLVDGKLPEKKGEDLTDFFMKHGKSVSDFEGIIPESKLHEYNAMPATVERFFDGSSFKPALVVDNFLDQEKFVTSPTGLLYRWNGIYWEVFEDSRMRREVNKLLKQEATFKRSKDVSLQLKDMAVIDQGRDMDDGVDDICLENGMLNTASYEFKNHHKKYYSSHCLEAFYDPESKCEMWLKFLASLSLHPDTIKVLQEFFGYCLTRDVKYQKTLHLYGPGSDGKSIISKILRALVGKPNTTTYDFQALSDEGARANLYKKYVNISSEVEGNFFFSDYYKRIASGDPINGRFLYNVSFEFEPYCKLVVIYNNPPRVKDTSDGFYRRILLISFTKQFKGKERIMNLEEQLLAELPGILNWSLEGLKRLRENEDFTESVPMANALREYMFFNNPMMGFIEEVCKVSKDITKNLENYSVTVEIIFSKYAEYCRKFGFKPIGLNVFGREIKRITGCEKKRDSFETEGKRLSRYHGISVPS